MNNPDLKPISDHIRRRTREWFKKAEHELAFLAVAPLDSSDPPTDTTGKLAHMAAEYSLKAYLMLNKHKITKSHDLVEILNECISIHQDTGSEVLRDDCQLLTKYRIELVYPGFLSEGITIAEARFAIQKAESIYKLILLKAQQLGYR